MPRMPSLISAFFRSLDEPDAVVRGIPTLESGGPGTLVIDAGRVLRLAWEDGALLATFPGGARTQVFLASPTEEAVRTAGLARLRFTLGPDGRPADATLVRDGQEVWRATRREQP